MRNIFKLSVFVLSLGLFFGCDSSDEGERNHLETGRWVAQGSPADREKMKFENGRLSMTEGEGEVLFAATLIKNANVAFELKDIMIGASGRFSFYSHINEGFGKGVEFKFSRFSGDQVKLEIFKIDGDGNSGEAIGEGSFSAGVDDKFDALIEIHNNEDGEKAHILVRVKDSSGDRFSTVLLDNKNDFDKFTESRFGLGLDDKVSIAGIYNAEPTEDEDDEHHMDEDAG